MPTRKTKTRAQMRQELARQAEIEQETGAEPGDFIDSEAETIERIQAALSDGPDAHTWLVRVNEVFKTPNGIKEGWAFNADLGEITTLRERIAQECGPGTYRCRVLRDDRPFKQYDLEIRMTMAQRRQLAGAASSPAAAVPAVVQPSAGGLSPELLRILDNQNRMIEAIANRPAGPTMTDLLAQMKMMRDMMPEPPASNVGFDMFMKAFDLAKTIQGEKGDSDGGGSTLIDLVRDAIKDLVPEIMKRLPPPQPAFAPPAPVLAAPPPPAAPQPAPIVAPAPPPMQKPQTDMDAVNQLKTYLLAEAQKGTDPAMCADYAMETMPAELWDAIGSAPDPLALLLQAFPEARPYQAWFAKLIAEFFEEGEARPEPTLAANAAARPN